MRHLLGLDALAEVLKDFLCIAVLVRDRSRDGTISADDGMVDDSLVILLQHFAGGSGIHDIVVLVHVLRLAPEQRIERVLEPLLL